MKVEVKNDALNSEIDEDFRGLLINSDQCIWLVCDDGAVAFGTTDELNNGGPPLVYNRLEWASAILNQGPFTVFNGSVTLSN